MSKRNPARTLKARSASKVGSQCRGGRRVGIASSERDLLGAWSALLFDVSLGYYPTSNKLPDRVPTAPATPTGSAVAKLTQLIPRGTTGEWKRSSVLRSAIARVSPSRQTCHLPF